MKHVIEIERMLDLCENTQRSLRMACDIQYVLYSVNDIVA